MSHTVADDQTIVNTQGIRYVSWGESSTIYSGKPHKFYVTVTYKGNHQTFGYQTEDGARNLFEKIRDAMIKTIKQV